MRTMAALVGALLSLETAAGLSATRRKALQWIVADSFWRSQGDQKADDKYDSKHDLIAFAEQFRELVAASSDAVAPAPGAALQHAKEKLGPALANEVRQLLTRLT